MNDCIVTEPSLRNLRIRISPCDDTTIAERARSIAQSVQVPWHELGRRTQHRVPFPQLVEFLPLANDGRTIVGETLHVVGKNLASLGFDFYHQEPMPYRFAIVRLPVGDDQWIHFQLKISWCRFLKPGWYDSGGRFVRIVELVEHDNRDAVPVLPLHDSDLN